MSPRGRSSFRGFRSPLPASRSRLRDDQLVPGMDEIGVGDLRLVRLGDLLPLRGVAVELLRDLRQRVARLDRVAAASRGVRLLLLPREAAVHLQGDLRVAGDAGDRLVRLAAVLLAADRALDDRAAARALDLQ